VSDHTVPQSAIRNPEPDIASASLILLVDDDHDFLDVTRHVLEAAGYRVACAGNPRAARDAMAREAMDSGFSLAREVKADPRLRDVPVVLLTAIGARLGYDFVPHTASDLAAMGADVFLEKPVTPDALLAEIKRLLRREAEEKTR
jgi:two-component system phosphate regulon response regulator PhoB